jgi:hypothetical protein
MCLAHFEYQKKGRGSAKRITCDPLRGVKCFDVTKGVTNVHNGSRR